MTTKRADQIQPGDTLADGRTVTRTEEGSTENWQRLFFTDGSTEIWEKYEALELAPDASR